MLINGIFLLLISILVIVILAFALYRLTRPKEPEVAYTPNYWNSSYSEPNYYFDVSPAMGRDTEIEDVEFASPNGYGMPPVDELTMPVKVPSFSLNAVAFLKHVRGGEELPERLTILKDEPVRFGRSKNLCDHMIDDVRVSRLHARITQSGGHFYINDEGSSGGTFVNQQRLSLTVSHPLNDGDLINFNEIAYQFVMHR